MDTYSTLCKNFYPQLIIDKKGGKEKLYTKDLGFDDNGKVVDK